MYMNKMQHNYILMNWHLQDMTARDLLQQRYTLPNGDTAWRPSPLVTAALEGKLVILDGIHRINPGTLAVLQRSGYEHSCVACV